MRALGVSQAYRFSSRKKAAAYCTNLELQIQQDLSESIKTLCSVLQEFIDRNEHMTTNELQPINLRYTDTVIECYVFRRLIQEHNAKIIFKF